ncbi:hypothetical protein B0H19DRAFT_1162116 [Mycena capillaripes]|nr:hypothetical protein B0H19DRAFT_1162116 [Mycena capillaripes]
MSTVSRCKGNGVKRNDETQKGEWDEKDATQIPGTTTVTSTDAQARIASRGATIQLRVLAGLHERAS